MIVHHFKESSILRSIGILKTTSGLNSSRSLLIFPMALWRVHCPQSPNLFLLYPISVTGPCAQRQRYLRTPSSARPCTLWGPSETWTEGPGLCARRVNTSFTLSGTNPPRWDPPFVLCWYIRVRTVADRRRAGWNLKSGYYLEKKENK